MGGISIVVPQDGRRHGVGSACRLCQGSAVVTFLLVGAPKEFAIGTLILQFSAFSSPMTITSTVEAFHHFSVWLF